MSNENEKSQQTRDRELRNDGDSPCPICSDADLATFFEMHDIPTSDGRLWLTQEQARKAPTGDIRLAFCRNCGYIGNLAFDPQKVIYNQGYNASLEYSSHYRQFIHELAEELVDRYALQHKKIIEIGCGSGEFLRLLCCLGQNEGLGFDPTPNARAILTDADPSITFIQDFYSERYAQYTADFVCCRHLLSSLSSPKELVNVVRLALQNGPTALAYFEMPDVRPILHDRAVWNLSYEHCSYFSAASLARFFAICGFDVVASASCFEGQYVGVTVKQTQAPAQALLTTRAALDELAADVATFAEQFRHSVAMWHGRLNTFSGRRVVAWGAGGRAISFLNALGTSHQIEYVVDINPQKQGTFLAGTGQQIVPPSFLADYKPELVIITNLAFEQEVTHQARDLGLSCDFLLA